MHFKLLVTAALTTAGAMFVLVSEDSIEPADSLIGSATRPESAAEMLALPPTSGEDVGGGFIEQLADDPRATLEWLLQPSSGDQRALLCADPHFRSAVTAAADRLMQAAQLQSRNDHAPALESFVQLWATVDLRSAGEWVHRIPAGKARDALMVRLAFAEAQTSPAEAARRVVDELPPGPAQEEAAVMVLHQWTLQDPSSAAAWVDLFPDSQFRERAQRELDGVNSYLQDRLATQ